MYVNVCVKMPALAGWWKGCENLKKYATCVTVEIALAVNLVINHYLPESCNLIHAMLRARHIRPVQTLQQVVKNL